MTSFADILNHPLTTAAVGFAMGITVAWLMYREKMIREGRMRYLACKDCGREHALSPDGSWHALRTSEEIEADEKRRMTKPPVMPSVPKCHHGVPLDHACERCLAELRGKTNLPLMLKCEHGIPKDRPCHICDALKQMDPRHG